MRKLVLILVVFSAFFSSQACASHRFVFLTFPKCGTGLAKKLFGMMSEELGYKEAKHYLFDHFYSFRNLPSGINPQVEALVTKVPTIVVVRDFRDALVSLTHWFNKRIREGSMLKMQMNWVPVSVQNEWLRLSFSGQMLTLINGNFHPEILHFSDEFKRNYGNMDYYLSRIQFPCIVRYEDLVGPKGGGSLEAQKDTINRIAEAIGILLNPEEVEYLSANLYGVREQDQGTGYSLTFRKGQVGAWVDAFDERMVELFKRNYNAGLIFFGYEEDSAWGY